MKKIVLTLGAFTFISLGFSQGDLRSTASLLNNENSYTITNGDAFAGKSLESGEIDCEEGNFGWSKDIWYKFVAESAEYTFKGNRNISNSFAFQVSKSDGSILTCERGFIGFGSSSSNSRVDFSLKRLTIGETYYIRVAVDFLGTDYFSVRITPKGIINNIKERGFKESISLFPNPATTTIEIDANSAIVNLKIYAITGELIQEKTNLIPDESIDIEHLNNGIYVLKLEGKNNEIYFERFTVEK